MIRQLASLSSDPVRKAGTRLQFGRRSERKPRGLFLPVDDTDQDADAHGEAVLLQG